MMLIDATDKTQAAVIAQTWSHHWDRLDPRRVTQVVKL